MSDIVDAVLGGTGGNFFSIKDSGKRTTFSGGMQRDTADGKTDYTLVLDGPMFERWAVHLTKGAVKYEKRNWMKAQGVEELDRAKESALRHFLQWFRGEADEDHAAAVLFNLNEAEYIKARIARDTELHINYRSQYGKNSVKM